MNNKSLTQDFKDKIFDANGEKKKILFFNTSIITMLEHRNIYIKKLEILVDCMSRHNDVVLIWRPRPFTEDEYISFEKSDPEIMEKYNEIVKDYRNKDYGIFDDSPDLERAISLSDAYYGDFSFVSEKFKSMGKRVIIWNLFCPELDVIYYSQIARADFEGFRYSILHNRNILVKTDLKTLNSEYFGNVPFLAYFANRAFHRIYTHKNNLVFIPFEADFIALYSFDTGVWSKIDLILDDKLIGDKGHFMPSIFHKNMIYLLPVNYRGIISYDFFTGEQKLVFDLSGIFPIGINEPWLMGHCRLDNNRYLLLSLKTPVMLIFNVETLKITVVDTNEIYGAAINYKGDIWLVSKVSGAVTKWTEEGNTFEKFDIDIDGFCNHEQKNNKMAFDDVKSLFEYNGWLYLFAAKANMCVRFNLNTHIFERLSELDEYCKFDDSSTHISVTDGTEIEGDTVYLSNRAKYILEYNAENKKTRIVPMRPDWSETELEILNTRFINALFE